MTVSIFIKKEILEIFRTAKGIILPVVFLFFGMMSPLTARFTNELLAVFGVQQGITIQLPEPVFTDSYLQLFKNLNFVALIVLVLVFAGTVSDEKAKGTAALMLTKNLSRTGFILGKLLTAVLFFTVVYAITSSICMFYAGLLFNKFYNDMLLSSFAIYWVYMVMVICISLLASVLSKNYMGSAVLAFLACIFVSIVGSIPNVSQYTPGALQGLPAAIVTGAEGISSAAIPLIEAAGIIIFCIAGSITLFRKQEL